MSLKSRIQHLSPGVKSSVALFLASIITRGISYIVTPIYTRLLPTEVFGDTSIFLTWFNLFGIVAMFSLSNGVFNNGMTDFPDKRDEYSFSLLILSNVITAIFSVILITAYPAINSYIGIDKVFIYLMIGLFFVNPAYSFWAVRQRYEYKYKYVVIWSIIAAVASPAIAIFCISRAQSSNFLYARVFGAEIPLLIIYVGFYIYLGIKANFKLKTEYWKTAFLFNLPLIPHYLSTYMLNSSDKLMISYLVSSSATAYYSVAYSVAAIATIVWSAVNSSLIPYTYENCKTGSYDKIKTVTRPIVTLFAAVCVFVIMLAPEVVAIMATADYMEAIYVIPPIVGGVFFQVQYFLYANVVYYYKKPKFVMYASVTATILNLILNYIFIKKYGYVAAGYTTLVCYALQAVLDYLAMKKIVAEDVYDMRLVAILSASLIGISLVSNFIYDFAIIRYVIVGLLIALALIFRRKLKNAVFAIRK